MAGTIVADTLQDGAGNSTAMDNAIYGSAKAWARWTGSTGAVLASYNVSSITRTGTGSYTIVFTNAMSDANYSWGGFSQASGGSQIITGNNTPTLPTASTLYVQTFNAATAIVDPTTCGIAVFR